MEDVDIIGGKPVLAREVPYVRVSRYATCDGIRGDGVAKLWSFPTILAVVARSGDRLDASVMQGTVFHTFRKARER